MTAPPASLRTRILKQRKLCSPAVIEALSRSATQTALAHPWVRQLLLGEPLHVAVYRAMPGEIDPRFLVEELERAGHTLCFPRMKGEALEMVPFESDGKFTTGPFGIEEPPASAPAVTPEKLDLVLVPGVVFGRRGERIGMGKGFYDRYLAACPRAARVALAAQFQVRDRVPQEPWDARLDLVITQRRGYLGARAQLRLGVFK